MFAAMNGNWKFLSETDSTNEVRSPDKKLEWTGKIKHPNFSIYGRQEAHDLRADAIGATKTTIPAHAQAWKCSTLLWCLHLRPHKSTRSDPKVNRNARHCQHCLNAAFSLVDEFHFDLNLSKHSKQAENTPTPPFASSVTPRTIA